MAFDFASITPRRQTGCIKFDRKPDLDPYWVADMDFPSAPCILEALHSRVDHGIFGYAQAHAGLESAISQYLLKRHQADVPKDHIVHLGGIVPALSLAARAFCAPQESVMTCTPVYPPFLGVHHDAKARLITVDHVKKDGLWTFDWEGMEAAVQSHTRVFFLCNPQNPLGRVFSAEEVERVADFCLRHDLVLISDEIHCDLVLDESASPFHSALRLPAKFRHLVITLLSPSKTWNIAGLGYAFAVISDDSLRRKFSTARGHTLAEINALGYYAAEAAYRDGESWRLALIEQLRSNRDFLVDFIGRHCPTLSVEPGEATYLAWIDARKMNVGNPANHLEQHAGLFLSDGAFFGWPGYLRFNFGCPRPYLESGLQKLADSLSKTTS